MRQGFFLHSSYDIDILIVGKPSLTKVNTTKQHVSQDAFDQFGHTTAFCQSDCLIELKYITGEDQETDIPLQTVEQTSQCSKQELEPTWSWM